MAKIKTNKYYEDFLVYYKKAKEQQEKSNLGQIAHTKSNMGDDLMEHVELYDVVQRKFAGFSQIKNDIFYGWSKEHPYYIKMQSGNISKERKEIATKWDGKQDKLGMAEWLYLFLLHAVTGSGINYAKKPSGYHNSLLFYLHECDTIEEMCELVKTHPKPFYTSIGYQFPKFPKPPKAKPSGFVGTSDYKPGFEYKRGGDYYLCEFAPRLVREMTDMIQKENRKFQIRELGEWMFKWNEQNGLNAYRFQYAAFLADIADFYPEYIELESLFYYGTNAVECISYLAEPATKMKKIDFLDEVMLQINRDTGGRPYDAEDVACDYIRWVENYIRPGNDYDHLDFDSIWNSSNIEDHPYGRQKAMLDLGLVETFNGMKNHPSDDKVIKEAGITSTEYKQKVKELYGT
jgi:hypothetical protein